MFVCCGCLFVLFLYSILFLDLQFSLLVPLKVIKDIKYSNFFFLLEHFRMNYFFKGKLYILLLKITTRSSLSDAFFLGFSEPDFSSLGFSAAPVTLMGKRSQLRRVPKARSSTSVKGYSQSSTFELFSSLGALRIRSSLSW